VISTADVANVVVAASDINAADDNLDLIDIGIPSFGLAKPEWPAREIGRSLMETGSSGQPGFAGAHTTT
jgi:hypothetical protein